MATDAAQLCKTKDCPRNVPLLHLFPLWEKQVRLRQCSSGVRVSLLDWNPDLGDRHPGSNSSLETSKLCDLKQVAYYL